MNARHVAQKALQVILPTSLVVWRGPARRPRVALTFDDGPTSLTRAYLDVLDQFGARSTFFVVGELCAGDPEIVEEIVARGHEVAAHGYTHTPFPGLQRLRALRGELDRTATLLPNTPRRRPLVRPPRGAVSLGSLAACALAGYTTALWSFDSGDWCTDSATAVIDAFREHPVGPGAIALLHDGQTWTLEALPSILEQLRVAGHELVTMGELLDR